jgi:hypothetical protein
MEKLLRLLIELINDPSLISLACTVFIVFYYLVSIKFINESKKVGSQSMWSKNGFFDIVTSFIWIVISILLILSLFELAGKKELTITYLIIYYFFFIFLFGILYGLLEWHWKGMLSNVDAET